MTTSHRIEPPNAEEIERLFRRPMVRGLRPLLFASIEIIKLARRFDWSAEGLEHVQRLDTPMVFAANHVSHADTPAILGTLPRAIRARTAVAAALDVFGADNGTRRLRAKRLLPLVVAAGFHAFAFDRHGPPMRSVRTSVQLIRSGWNLLLYPEGTRSRNGRVAPFKLGVGVLARFTERPIVPVHVEGGDRVLSCGAILPRPGRIIVRYGAPLRFEPGESAADFTARLEASVSELGLPTPHGTTTGARPDDRRPVTKRSVSNQPA